MTQPQNVGCTREEIVEVIMQMAVYASFRHHARPSRKEREAFERLSDISKSADWLEGMSRAFFIFSRRPNGRFYEKTPLS